MSLYCTIVGLHFFQNSDEMTVKQEISDGYEYEREEGTSVSNSASSNLFIDDSAVAETMTRETKPVSDDDSYQNRSLVNESRKPPTATKKGKKVKSKQLVTSDEVETQRKRKYKKRKLKPNPDVEISEDGRTFKCAFCHREWRNKGILFALILKEDLKVPNLGTTYPTGNLERHILYHYNEKGFTCQYCGKQFNTNWDLTKHIRVHTGDYFHSFQCIYNRSINSIWLH